MSVSVRSLANENFFAATFPDAPECTPEKRCTVLNCPFESYPSNYNFTCLSYDKLRYSKPEEIDREILQDSAFESGYEVSS